MTQVVAQSGLGARPGTVPSFLDRTVPHRPPDREVIGKDDPQWRTLADGIRLIALRALGDATQAEEVAQEAITRGLATLAQTREAPILDLGGFVYGIARHLIADIHRGRGRTISLDAVVEPEAQSANALDAMIAAEEAGRVRIALEELPAPDRDLLRLFFVDGLQAEEIGLRLGEPPANIRKRKSRALMRLRATFGHDEHVRATGKA